MPLHYGCLLICSFHHLHQAFSLSRHTFPGSKLHFQPICHAFKPQELFAGKLLTLWSITKFKASHWPERAAVLRISDQGAWEVVELPSGPRT